MKLEKSLLKRMFEGLLLYGCEMWTIKKYAGSEGDVVVEKNNEDHANKKK